MLRDDRVKCCVQGVSLQLYSITSKLIYILQQLKQCTSNKSCQKVTKPSINNKGPSSLIFKTMTQLMHLMGSKADKG